MSEGFLLVLFLIVGIVAFFVGLIYGKNREKLKFQKQLPSMRNDIANSQRANIKGKIAEIFSPYLPNFPYNASECKFIGDPIDYIVFEGLAERNVRAIHFLEVKSDKSRLNQNQKAIKNLIDSIESDKITFEEYNFQTENNKEEALED